MSIRKLLIIFLTLSSCGLAQAQIKNSFSSAEHTTIGNSVMLYRSKIDAGVSDSPMSLPNGLQLTYGEIVSLADFYGTPGQPISEGKTLEDRRRLFLYAFNSFADVSATNFDTQKKIEEVNALLAVIHDEEKEIFSGLDAGRDPEDVYSEVLGDHSRKFNCITGGGCGNDWFLYPGRYLQIAKTDDDHFGENALVAYHTGHQIALEQAKKAHDDSSQEELTLAYQMNAFASHFLSDRFSGGHMRTPRIKLRTTIKPEVVGSLLAHYMHDEESHYGLHVRNIRGDEWMAYGDKTFFTDRNADGRKHVEEAFQVSADEVFNTFITGELPTKCAVNDLVPYPQAQFDAEYGDIEPLFYWNDAEKVLYRRVVTADVYSYQMTKNWWGWSTLAQLASERGLPNDTQQKLIAAGVGKDAIKYGLIKDKALLRLVAR